MGKINSICIHDCDAEKVFGYDWFGCDWMANPKIFDKFTMLTNAATTTVDGVMPREKKSVVFPEIKNVIFHDPATIVWWEDGTKTVVKAYEDKFDAEKGLTMAIAKKALGNKGNYYEVIKKWVGDLMPGGEGVAEKKTLKKSKKDGDVGEEIKKTVEYERKNKKKRN